MAKLLLAVSNKVKLESVQLGFKTSFINIIVEDATEVMFMTEIISSSGFDQKLLKFTIYVA